MKAQFFQTQPEMTRRKPFGGSALVLFVLLAALSSCWIGCHRPATQEAENTPSAPTETDTQPMPLPSPAPQTVKSSNATAGEGLVVCVDESLAAVLKEILDLLERTSGSVFTLNADASEAWLVTLADPAASTVCDLVLLEGRESILTLSAKNAVWEDGARALAADQLVLFSRVDHPVEDAIKALHDAKKQTVSVAHGNTFTGVHTENILKRLGLLPRIRPALRLQDKRSLVYRRVLRGPETLGIGYRADVLAEPELTIRLAFPQAALQDIVYWGAVGSRSRVPDTALETLHVITSRTMGDIWRAHHFLPPNPESRQLHEEPTKDRPSPKP